MLALGDSHTFGGGEGPEGAYPAQLQHVLDRESPGKYSVLNLGIPGMNTAQLKNRFALHVARHEPDVVVLWCGVNDTWNIAEVDLDANDIVSRLDKLMGRLRVYRFVRVWLHDRTLERDKARADEAMGRHEVHVNNLFQPNQKWRTTVGGLVEEVRHTTGGLKLGSEIEQRIIANYTEIVRLSRSLGVPIVMLAYPLDVSRSAVANRAIREVAQLHDIRIVETAPAVRRVPKEHAEWAWGLHPNAHMYGEIALDVAEAVKAIGEGGS